MNVTELMISQWLADVMWPFLRISALFATAPVLNLKQVPARFKILLAFLISWLLVPVLPPMPIVPMFSADAFLMLLQQLGIGFAIGFILQLAFNALIFGGQAVAFKMGLGFAQMNDPQNGVQVPVLSQYYLMMGMLGFVMMNGHLLLLQLIADSFTIIPVSTTVLSPNAFWEVAAWGSNVFAGGVLMATPIMFILLMTNLALGIVSRASPQLNVLAIGFPITILVGLVLIWVTIPQVLTGFGELVNQAFDDAALIISLK